MPNDYTGKEDTDYSSCQENAIQRHVRDFFDARQLYELQGLAVAEAVFQLDSSRVLVVAGPIGLVAARHLQNFGGRTVDVLLTETHGVTTPDADEADIWHQLLGQLDREETQIYYEDQLPTGWYATYDNVVDASLEENGTLLDWTNENPNYNEVGDRRQSPLRVRVDWRLHETSKYDVQICLLPPERHKSNFAVNNCRCFCAGRYLPKHLLEQHKLSLLKFGGTNQVVELVLRPLSRSNTSKERGSPSDSPSSRDNDSWAREYAQFCAEQEALAMHRQPLGKDEKSTHNGSTSWQMEYADYCAKQEVELSSNEKNEATEREPTVFDENQQKTQNRSNLQDNGIDNESWQLDYAKHCSDREESIFKQPRDIQNKNTADSVDESWRIEYALYCAEHELKQQDR